MLENALDLTLDPKIRILKEYVDDFKILKLLFEYVINIEWL